jgi:hypothetical protein
MSFDLGVWYSDTPMSVEQAKSYYAHINSDWVDLRRRPEFDKFVLALRARFADLRSSNDPPARVFAPRSSGYVATASAPYRASRREHVQVRSAMGSKPRGGVSLRSSTEFVCLSSIRELPH